MYYFINQRKFNQYYKKKGGNSAQASSLTSKPSNASTACLLHHWLINISLTTKQWPRENELLQEVSFFFIRVFRRDLCINQKVLMS